MLVSEFVTAVNDALRGIDDDAPVTGSSEWNYWVRILNRKKNELYQDATKQWQETFVKDRSLGTISVSTTPSFELEEDFLAPSDYAYVVTTTGQVVEYPIVKAQERVRTCREVYLAGLDPLTLYFSNEIKTGESIVGGTLYMPGYYLPDDVSSANETLPFSDPYWAVLAVAAEVAGNDIVYEDKEANLTAKANNLYSLMAKKNRRGTYNNPRRSPYSTQRIRSY